MTLITGMLISGKMSIAIFASTNGVASTMSIAITMNVYGRRSASPTTENESRPASGELSPMAAILERLGNAPIAGAVDSLPPTRHFRRGLGARHVRLEALVEMPVRGELVARFPQRGGEAGKIGRAERG